MTTLGAIAKEVLASGRSYTNCLSSGRILAQEQKRQKHRRTSRKQNILIEIVSFLDIRRQIQLCLLSLTYARLCAFQRKYRHIYYRVSHVSLSSAPITNTSFHIQCLKSVETSSWSNCGESAFCPHSRPLCKGQRRSGFRPL